MLVFNHVVSHHQHKLDFLDEENYKQPLQKKTNVIMSSFMDCLIYRKPLMVWKKLILYLPQLKNIGFIQFAKAMWKAQQQWYKVPGARWLAKHPSSSKVPAQNANMAEWLRSAMEQPCLTSIPPWSGKHTPPNRIMLTWLATNWVAHNPTCNLRCSCLPHSRHSVAGLSLSYCFLQQCLHLTYHNEPACWGMLIWSQRIFVVT